METITPQIGDRKVLVSRSFDGGYFVEVRVYKHNTLRGDCYWVTDAARTFRKESDALRWGARFS